jgi:hypothetical protein
MASAIFAPFLTQLAKIPNDDSQCWASLEAHDGYFLDVQHEDDAYLVSHYHNRDEDPYSQYVVDSSHLRGILSEIPISSHVKRMALYRNGICIREEIY